MMLVSVRYTVLDSVFKAKVCGAKAWYFTVMLVYGSFSSDIWK